MIKHCPSFLLFLCVNSVTVRLDRIATISWYWWEQRVWQRWEEVCLCESRSSSWADSSHHSNNEVHSTLLHATVTYSHSPLTNNTRSLLSHAHTLIQPRRDEEKGKWDRNEGRAEEIFTSFTASFSSDWPLEIECAERTALPRSHGF